MGSDINRRRDNAAQPWHIGKLYSLEPTGDQTLLAARAGEQPVVAKGHRTFRQNIDTPIAFTFLKDRIYLFDGESGERLRY